MKNILNSVGIFYLLLSFVGGIVLIYFLGVPVDEFIEGNLIAVLSGIGIIMQGVFVCAICAYMVHMLENVEEIKRQINNK